MTSRPDTQQEKTEGADTGTAAHETKAPAGAETPTADHIDPLIGRVLAHYRLEQRLGSGGMGLLYRATDLQLGRLVAVKLLARHLVSNETAKARFVREARAASALDHPNIANVHDIGEEDGELFIVMALYEGETLKQRLEKGPLTVNEAVAILHQVSLGLEAAHRAGIVHRDIKPANILMTRSGTVKILDFGLAKLVSDSQGQAMTQEGQTPGTVLYMSPEQLRAEPVDHRSDLWSLGVLAYELLAGVSPFQTDSSAATAARILDEEPPSLAAVPGVPDWLAQLVSELLQKNPAERPQSASEVLRRLEHPDPANRAERPHPSLEIKRRRFPFALASSIAAFTIAAAALFLYFQRRETRNQAGAIKSLVVLPFINDAANADMEYLSDGIAETLIDNFSQIPELQVIARNTAFRYKGKDVDLQKLRRELSVDAVLTGQVQQLGSRLVVHAELVSLGTGSQLWGERYNRQLTDVLIVEEEIAKAISEKLRPRLAAEVQHRVTRLYTENPEAYQMYLRGRYFWNKRTNESLKKGIEYFQQAIERDPNYALAHAGLADSYNFLAGYGYAPLLEAQAKAEAAAVKAIALDDELAEAHAALGNLRVEKWDWLSAETELKRAIALNPNYALAHNWYGLYLNRMGHVDQAAAEFARALQLDPASAVYAANQGASFCRSGQFDHGVGQLKESLRLDPSRSITHALLVFNCYLPKQMYQAAVDELEAALTVNPNDPQILGSLAYAYVVSGNRDRALMIFKKLKERDESPNVAPMIAQVHVALGDKDRAFEWLEKAYQQRSPWLGSLNALWTYDPLRSDPRFVDLVRRVGLPP